jgi:hypothetical protein
MTNPWVLLRVRKGAPKRIFADDRYNATKDMPAPAAGIPWIGINVHIAYWDTGPVQDYVIDNLRGP